MDAQSFGAFIARMRKEQDMTQAELAGRLHVTDKAVSRWERGLGFPDIKTIEPLADALGVSVFELIRSERCEGETIPSKEASEALTDTLKLLQQKRGFAFELTVSLTCLAFALLCLFYRGIGAFVPILVFFSSVLVLAVGLRQALILQDEDSRRISMIVCCVAYVTAAGSLSSVLPETVVDQYGDLILLGMETVFFVMVLYRMITFALREHAHMERRRFFLWLLLYLSGLALTFFVLKGYTDQIGAACCRTFLPSV